MKFSLNTAEVFIPDGVAEEQALGRTTHLCLAAHQDDIEIMLWPAPMKARAALCQEMSEMGRDTGPHR